MDLGLLPRMPVNLPHQNPSSTAHLRANLEALRAAEARDEISPAELRQSLTQQVDQFRINKQAPRGCFGRTKYGGRDGLDLAVQKLNSKRGTRPGTVNWLQAQMLRAPAPKVSDVFEQVRSASGFTAREMEARLFKPAGLLAGYVGGEDAGRVTCKQAYARLKGQRWASSCGQTSDLLKSLISDTWQASAAPGSKPGLEILQDLKDAIRNPANTHIRVQIGCHSFMIENSGPDCRLYQSYMAIGYGGYGLADSLQTDVSMPRQEFLEHLQDVFDPDKNDAASVKLFRGTCDPEANAEPGDVRVSFETTSQPRSAAELRRAMQQKLAADAAEWQRVAGSDQLASEYALAHLN